jgi:hypothetical protein
MSRPVHFEIHAADPPRAIAFYEKLFGWTFTAWAGQPYWLVKTGEPPEPGIDGGLLERRGPPPVGGQAVNAYVCTVAVADLDATMTRAQALGGGVALARMPIPGVGWLGYLTDTEGNIFGVMQSDPAAK